MIYENDFFNFTESNFNLTENEIIELNKKYSEFMKNVRKEAKLDRCLLCNKACTSFCNSHTLPQFIMKEISHNGKFYYMNTFLGLPVFKTSLGINEANTFHTICHDCDKLFFSTYENPNNYSVNLTQKLLAEIALKNNLRMLSKRILESTSNLETYKKVNKASLASLNSLKTIEINNLDIYEFSQSIKLAKATIQGKKKGYYLIDYIKLNYTTKMAFQGQVALISGFDNDLINDIYCKNIRYKIQSLHISIFPINGETHIFLFIEDGDTRYSKFYKKFKKLDLKEKLKTINYIIIRYSEEWLLTSKLDESILKNDALKNVMKITSNPKPASTLEYNNEYEFKNKMLQKAVITFSLKDIPHIPNFLESI